MCPWCGAAVRAGQPPPPGWVLSSALTACTALGSPLVATSSLLVFSCNVLNVLLSVYKNSLNVCNDNSIREFRATFDFSLSALIKRIFASSSKRVETVLNICGEHTTYITRILEMHKQVKKNVTLANSTVPTIKLVCIVCLLP